MITEDFCSQKEDPLVSMWFSDFVDIIDGVIEKTREETLKQPKQKEL